MSEQTRRDLDTSIPSVEDAALYWQWGGYMWQAPERFYRMIAKVKADALREVAGDIEDRENCYNDAMSAACVPGEVGRSNVIHAYEAILEEPYSWLRERAKEIEGEA